MYKNYNNRNNLCFIRTENGYEPITYTELCHCKQTDASYANKLFILLQCKEH